MKAIDRKNMSRASASPRMAGWLAGTAAHQNNDYRIYFA